MATTLVVADVKTFRDNSTLVTWTLGDADTGAAVESPGSNLRSVQVTGTFGSSTVTIQGSNDGTNYVTLKDSGGTTMTFTSASTTIRNVLEVSRFIRAISSGGTAAATVVSLLMIRRGL